MRLVMNVSDRIHVLTDGHTLAGDAVAEVRAIKAVVEAISASTTPAWPLVDQILEVLCRLKREGITVLPVDQNAPHGAGPPLYVIEAGHHRGRLRRRAHGRRLVRAGYLGL